MGIYILNEKYPKNTGQFNKNKSSQDEMVQQIQDAFQTIVWFTYKRCLEKPLPSSNYKGDAGWGCMLRTG